MNLVMCFLTATTIITLMLFVADMDDVARGVFVVDITTLTATYVTAEQHYLAHGGNPDAPPVSLEGLEKMIAGPLATRPSLSLSALVPSQSFERSADDRIPYAQMKCQATASQGRAHGRSSKQDVVERSLSQQRARSKTPSVSRKVRRICKCNAGGVQGTIYRSKNPKINCTHDSSVRCC